MNDDRLTVGSLFAGIGGIEPGLGRTGGFKTAWQVEPAKEVCGMALLKCKVTQGLRDTEKTVEVSEYGGRREFMPIDGEMIEQRGGQSYLPVRVLQVDKANKGAVVALPVEADSGAHRIWVKLADLIEHSEASV